MDTRALGHLTGQANTKGKEDRHGPLPDDLLGPGGLAQMAQAEELRAIQMKGGGGDDAVGGGGARADRARRSRCPMASASRRPSVGTTSPTPRPTSVVPPPRRRCA